MAKDVVLIGAGGHAKVIADIILRSGDNFVGFLDDNIENGKEIFKGHKVIGTVLDVRKYLDCYFIIAVGDNKTRAEIAEKLEVKYYTAIHPNAIVADTVKMGEGTVVMAGAVINSDTIIGKHCIINTACSIDHDNQISDYVHVSPGAHLAGGVTVGKKSWICTGAIIINNISIINDIIVGAGATVLSDIGETGIYVGTPAKKKIS